MLAYQTAALISPSWSCCLASGFKLEIVVKFNLPYNESVLFPLPNTQYSYPGLFIFTSTV